jgi:hypothetical protein
MEVLMKGGQLCLFKNPVGGEIVFKGFTVEMFSE